MREIKFRGYNPATQEIVTWEGMQGWAMSGLGSPNIMQYTGLKDKNGKEIYEGDIVVRVEDKENLKAIVEWNEDNCGFDADLKYEPRDFMELINRNRIKVIGNIYENPEL